MTHANAPTLITLLERVAADTAPPPRVEAIDAIRTLEEALVSALSGQTLRGLPNLGTVQSPFVGANVRGSARVSFPRDGSNEGPATLIIRPSGRLAIAWTVRSPDYSKDHPVFEFAHRGAEDVDLRVEDLPLLLTLLPKVLTEHLAKVDRTQAGWEETRALAHRVLDLVPGKG